MDKPKRTLDKVFESLAVEATPEGWLYDNNGNLNYEGAALSVGLYCCHLANLQKRNGEFTFNIENAVQATAYGERTIWRAMNILQQKENGAESPKAGRQLLVCTSGGEFKSSTYSIASATGQHPVSVHRGDEPETLRTLLFNAGLGYDEIPKHIMENLNKLKGQPLAIALTGLRQAQDYNRVVFTAVLKHWKEMAGVTKDEAMKKAWSIEEFNALLHVSYVPRRRTVGVALYNPSTHKALKDVKAEAVERTRERDVLRQTSAYEDEQQTKFSQAELEDWFMHEFPQAIKYEGSDEFYTDCHVCHGMEGGRVPSKPSMRSTFAKPEYPVGAVTCHAHIKGRKDKEVFCSFSGKGKVPYHLVAIRDGITPSEARHNMERYIMEKRESQ
jgi:hypothetical protein